MLATLLAGVCAALVPVRAEPLGKEACDVLKAEEATLVSAGVKADMERGPEWAKTNVAPDRMQQIARLIDVAEQLSFRCREIKAPPRQKAAAAPDAAGAQVSAQPKGAENTTGTRPPSGKKVQAKAGTASSQQPASQSAPAPTVVRAKPAAKPAPRPKVPQAPAQVRTKPPVQQKPGLFSLE